MHERGVRVVTSGRIVACVRRGSAHSSTHSYCLAPSVATCLKQQNLAALLMPVNISLVLSSRMISDLCRSRRQLMEPSSNLATET